jgi:hypothetical protein
MTRYCGPACPPKQGREGGCRRTSSAQRRQTRRKRAEEVTLPDFSTENILATLNPHQVD